MIEEQHIIIVFDTNILESRFSHNKVDLMCLNKIKPDSLFYQVIKYVKEQHIESYVTFYISAISKAELLLHMRTIFEKGKQEFECHYDNYKKAYGDILSVGWEFSCQTLADYVNFADTIMDEFLIANNCVILDYPQEISFIEDLIQQCLRKQPPFQEIKGNGKTYHDAGFKDAIIYNSILRHISKTDDKCILVTRDKDFDQIEGENIWICGDNETFVNTISKIFDLNSSSQIKKMIVDRIEEHYLKEYIIKSIGDIYDASVTLFEVIDVDKCKEGDLYNVRIRMIINEQEYKIICKYDLAANEVLDVKHDEENE